MMDASPRARALAYDGKVGELYSIFLLNILLTLLTLGIFRFWAITRYRRYFWSHASFQNERFAYTGTGGELFVGFLLAGLALLGIGVVAAVLSAGAYYLWPPLALLPLVSLYGFIVALAAGAVFSAQRYRLSRTQWCGIRGAMTGSMLAYGVRSALYGVLALATLLQMAPWVQIRLTERRINASSFGNAQFSFRGSARRVYLPFLLTCIGIAVLFAAVLAGAYGLMQAIAPGVFAAHSVAPGWINPAEAARIGQLVIGVAVIAGVLLSTLSSIVSCWYVAVFERHVVGNTALGTMRLASSMTGGGLLGLVVGNLLIALFTLGLGYPVLLHRNMRYLSRTLWVEGGLDADALTQASSAGPRFGEGMFQQLDATGWL